MPQNFFITGAPKTGKTTLLKDLIKELKKDGLRVGGFVSPDERHHGTRTAFFVMDVETGKKGELASVNGDGPKVSKYHVNVGSFENIALPAMRKFSDYDVFFIDEIGVMEMKSDKFSRFLDIIMDADTPLIATLHEQFVDTYSGSGEVLDLDSESRQAVYLRLLRKARESITKKPAKEMKKEKPAPKKEEKKTAPKKEAAKKMPAKTTEKKEKAVKPKKEAEEKPRAEKKKGGLFDGLKKIFGG